MNNALINTLEETKDDPRFEPLREAVRQMGKPDPNREWIPIESWCAANPLKPISCQLD